MNQKNTKQKEKNILPNLSGLEQSFLSKTGEQVVLKDFLKKDDWWEMKKRKSTMIILTHDAVKKIAREAALRHRFSLLKTEGPEQNYLVVVECTVADSGGETTSEWGESNRENLGTRGRKNPINMAQKRAYDRAVFAHLGITGLLEENELPDEEIKSPMETLVPDLDQQKEIAPYISNILLAKNKSEMVALQSKLKTAVKTLKPNQVTFLRELYKKQLGVLSKTQF